MTEAHLHLTSGSPLKELSLKNRTPSTTQKPVVLLCVRCQAGSPSLPGPERGLSHGTRRAKFN